MYKIFLYVCFSNGTTNVYALRVTQLEESLFATIDLSPVNNII